MEFSEDSMDRTLVFKGKRSKRPRQFMAVAMVTSTSSTAGGGGGSGGAEGGTSGGDDVYNYSSSIQYSSSTTSTTQISTSSTEEDEDMANCLILLAQSGRCQKLQVESTERKMVKISSRKFTEMATTTTGKAGFYVYECKTCNRTFPSFQALGGHRTSHKKIKTVAEGKKCTADSVSSSVDQHQQQQQQEEKTNRIITASVTSTQIVNKGNSNSHSNLINNKPKIHECSICGAEFSSGQALGGHMRRHRPPTITATHTKITVDETSDTSDNSSHDDDQNSKEKPKIFLSLDLNLPASPEDDHHRDTNNFEFSANQQSLVFSAAALVDCHY
ncbi:zinc finger protein ZAT5-like [Solanum dulcamara]|uniref:zinc finger protein ZAT5-like n=1 Tax=Solanum dulcamara TaxID=45834 RepID=UPI002485DB17|nr:zinc finger protein ZAT5-like [Solanum dulcamara]